MKTNRWGWLDFNLSTRNTYRAERRWLTIEVGKSWRSSLNERFFQASLPGLWMLLKMLQYVPIFRENTSASNHANLSWRHTRVFIEKSRVEKLDYPEEAIPQAKLPRERDALRFSMNESAILVMLGLAGGT